MTAFWGYIKREPVVAMAILKFLIVIGGSFGLTLNTEQRVEMIALAGAILGTGAGITRSQVSPTATMPIAAKISIDAKEQADEAEAKKADGE